MLDFLDFHTERASIPLRKLAEVDVAFAGLSLFCRHRDATDNLTIKGAGLDENGDPVTAPAWTDGKAIFYGPKFEKFSLEEQMAVSAHEILHIAWRHISRAKQLIRRFGGEYNNYLFNVATDAIINQTLILIGKTLPRPCIVLSELFKEVFGEEVDPEEVLSEWDAERLYIRLVSLNGKAGSGGSGLGLGSGGGRGRGDMPSDQDIVDALEKYLEQNGFEEDFYPTSEDSGNEVQEDMEWQQRFAHAISQARIAGTGIGKIGHKIADVPKTRTPWEVVLRRLVTKAAMRKPRPSFDRPTRRFLAMDSNARQLGVRRPVYEQGTVMNSANPRIVVCVDVSGSISDRLLRQFAGEIAGIGRRTGAEIHVLVFDTEVISRSKMAGQSYEQEITKIEFARGGGTSFVKVMEEAIELDPSMIVLLTDLCGPFGAAPKKTPVVWAIPDAKPPEQPPFGRVISLAA